MVIHKLASLLSEDLLTFDYRGSWRRGALFHYEQPYRYMLWRTWDECAPSLLWIMLNPSTADEVTDDSTIRRCTTFAKARGFGEIGVVNLFALRATQPSALWSGPMSSIGPMNDEILFKACCACQRSEGTIAVGWGVNGGHLSRDLEVLKSLSEFNLKCLGTTKNGYPRHPLYVKGMTEFCDYQGRMK